MREVAVDRPDLGVYLMNSVNPFRLEGQKSIMFRVLEARGWRVPDWIIVPGGNLGNASAFGKAFVELKALNLIDKLPRLAVVNAGGANTLYRLYEENGLRWSDGGFDANVPRAFYESAEKAKTVASAIEIGRPVNLPKALRSLDALNGVVRQVGDDAILEGRAKVARMGFGCEPASGASVAGLQALLADGTITARRAGRVHPHRPRTQGPERDGRVPRRRVARRPQQPAGRGGGRFGRDCRGVELTPASHATSWRG